MNSKRSEEFALTIMLLMGMKAGGRIEEDAAEQLEQTISDAFSRLEADNAALLVVKDAAENYWKEAYGMKAEKKLHKALAALPKHLRAGESDE
jgi:hypothetical protein